MEKDEQNFLLNLKNNSPAAYREVIQKYSGHLLKACFGLGFNETEAEDVTQSVWETFFEVVHKFEGRSSLRTFLFGILYNKASEFRKQSQKFNTTDNLEELIDSHFDDKGNWRPTHSPIDPDQFLESSQTLNLIKQCLELLPLNQKIAFILKDIDEEPSENICTHLKISTTNLGVILFRARNQLRECIERKSR